LHRWYQGYGGKKRAVAVKTDENLHSHLLMG
jgi:hypothetical protein